MTFTKHINNFDFDNTLALEISWPIVTDTRDAVFNTWQTLEHILEQVDSQKDHNFYQTVEDLAAVWFESWISLKDMERRG
jgi:hypothetical protein